MSVNALAKALHVSASRINDVVREQRGVTADTALRLSRYFGGSQDDAQGWINMQATYDFKAAQAALATFIAQEVQPREPANCASNSTR